MGDVVQHPAVPVRAWVAYPVDNLWAAKLTGCSPEVAALGDAPPVTFDMLLDIFCQPDVRMGLPLIFQPWTTALGGAA